MIDLYEKVCAPDTFTAKQLFEAAETAGVAGFELRVSRPGERSRNVKAFHLGSCGDFAALYLELGEPGEGIE